MKREFFREHVMQRDNYRCVNCDVPATEVHHIMERRLFVDGGYLMDNGVSLCNACHWLAEMTLLSTDELRELAGITKIELPAHLDPVATYDKWGNQLLENGTRSPGELFFDPSVMKIMREAGLLRSFVPYIKYPRTVHLPWSNASDGDRILAHTNHFDGRYVIVTEKMDGENTTMYNDHIHARSVTGTVKNTQSWVRRFWSNIRYDIPDGYRICGENLYAEKTIHYDNLDSFFLGFGVWNWEYCLNWNQTVEWLDLFDIKRIPVLYCGIWDKNALLRLADESAEREGYVVRTIDAFNYNDFTSNVAKFVRKSFKPKDTLSYNFVTNNLASES